MKISFMDVLLFVTISGQRNDAEDCYADNAFLVKSLFFFFNFVDVSFLISEAPDEGGGRVQKSDDRLFLLPLFCFKSIPNWGR